MKKPMLPLILLFAVCLASAQERNLRQELEDRYNFYLGNDFGRNGYYDQKPIAEKMGELAEEIDIDFIAALGDVHHFMGVASVQDPLWMTNYELVYSHPELMIEWFPILGNHEYRGNTQACLDYHKVSRRWMMPGRNYTRVCEVDDAGTTLRLLFIDTAPLIDKYVNNSEEYPDAGRQDQARELAWIDSVLTADTSTWTVVMGHHPVYAQTTKVEEERTDMQKRLDPLLRKHKVDFYISGHIHSHQHIHRTDSDVDYIVNTSCSGSREVSPIEGTVFCDGGTGFSICSASAEDLRCYMLNKEGKILHVVERKKDKSVQP
jgi:3',5'-cyclic AMP phosphodiesterase CpdA